jgi:hypothetical protein
MINRTVGWLRSVCGIVTSLQCSSRSFDLDGGRLDPAVAVQAGVLRGEMDAGGDITRGAHHAFTFRDPDGYVVSVNNSHVSGAV